MATNALILHELRTELSKRIIPYHSQPQVSPAHIYQFTMCIVNYNQYSCAHTLITTIAKCPENTQGLPCSQDWREEAEMMGDCMACLMEEPGPASAAHPWYGPGSDYDSRGRLRPSRFPTLKGCRWYDTFPGSKNR